MSKQIQLPWLLLQRCPPGDIEHTSSEPHPCSNNNSREAKFQGISASLAHQSIQSISWRRKERRHFREENFRGNFGSHGCTSYVGDTCIFRRSTHQKTGGDIRRGFLDFSRKFRHSAHQPTGGKIHIFQEFPTCGPPTIWGAEKYRHSQRTSQLEEDEIIFQEKIDKIPRNFDARRRQHSSTKAEGIYLTESLFPRVSY